MRRRGIPCSAMYAVLLATLVNAGAADAKAQKLRLSPEYIAHLCQANSFKRAEGIRRFASEFGDGYRPAAYELAEVLRNPLPCEQGYVQPPTDFRCRLDRVIFRDVEKGEKFAANAASYEFKFEYEPNVIEDRPRPIGDKILNQVFGDITVRGTYKGKRVYLSQSWIKGTPTYLVSSSSDGKWFCPMPGKRVPIVTAENFNLYRFAIEAEGFGSDGPISDRVFTPDGCRA